MLDHLVGGRGGFAALLADLPPRTRPTLGGALHVEVAPRAHEDRRQTQVEQVSVAGRGSDDDHEVLAVLLKKCLQPRQRGEALAFGEIVIAVDQHEDLSPVQSLVQIARDRAGSHALDCILHRPHDLFSGVDFGSHFGGCRHQIDEVDVDRHQAVEQRDLILTFYFRVGIEDHADLVSELFLGALLHDDPFLHANGAFLLL